MLKNTKISIRLSLLIIISTLSLIILTGISILQIRIIGRSSEQIGENFLPGLIELTNAHEAMNTVLAAEKSHISAVDADAMEELEQTISLAQADVESSIEQFSRAVNAESEEESLSAFNLAWQSYLTTLEQVLQFSRENRDEDARNLSQEVSAPLFAEAEDAINALEAANLVNALAVKNQTEIVVQQATAFMVSTVLVALIISVTLGVTIMRSITQPVADLAAITRRVAEGDLNQTATVTGDEIGQLAESFNQMTLTLHERLEKESELRKIEQEANRNAVARETIVQRVNDYNRFIEQVATGDLTARLSVNGAGDDELSTLGHNPNGMVESLTDITNQIRDASADISVGAAEILAATSQQASSATENSSAISQTSTTIDEVRAIAEQAYDKAQQVAEQARHTHDVSQEGQLTVSETITSMDQIKERVEGIAENILALSGQTQQIGEITATVNEIAAQSNLLALNASVEAARAGEHGKGFAVVAVEVRNLAEQSRQATGQVKAILNEIQRATNAAVMATEEGSKGVEIGVELTGQTGDAIQQLATSISESANAAQQIVASAQQQMTGMEQIALAMHNINQATMQNLSSTRQVEVSAQELTALAQQMEAIVARYKLK